MSMELQLAAVLASLALGAAVLLLFFGKCWQPLARTDLRVKDLADAVEALLRQRAEVLGHDPAPAADPVRTWLRRVQEAQDEMASIKARHDGGQLYVIRLVQYLLPTGPSRGWPSSSSRRCARSGSRALAGRAAGAVAPALRPRGPARPSRGDGAREGLPQRGALLPRSLRRRAPRLGRRRRGQDHGAEAGARGVRPHRALRPRLAHRRLQKLHGGQAPAGGRVRAQATRRAHGAGAGRRYPELPPPAG